MLRPFSLNHFVISSLIFVSVQAMAQAKPWWDNWPRVTFNSSLESVQKTNSNFVNAANGAADEGRAPYFREVILDENQALYKSLKENGIKKLAWIEGQGEARSIIGAVFKKPDGTYKWNTKLNAAEMISHNWLWDHNGPGKNPEANTVVWFGLPAFADNEPWQGPFTRSNLGVSLPKYPNGQPAIGFLDNTQDPRKSKLYDAMASKNIFGKHQVNGGDAGTNPIGKIPFEIGGEIKPVGDFNFGKDIASPWWLEYMRTTIRALLKAGMDGFWVDNYTGFDSISSWPINNSFGEFSVAGFRKYLATRPGIVSESLSAFDVRKYLLAKFKEKNPSVEPTVSHPFWSDPYWLSDRVWHAYMSYKSDVSAQFAKDLYKTIKDEASSLSLNPNDIYVGGNDIPALTLGVISGNELDMVNTEYNPGWSLDVGSIGRGLPVNGTGLGAGTFYSLATQYAKSQHAVVWHYLDGDTSNLLQKKNLGVHLGLEALSHNVLLNGGNDGARCAGTDESQGEINKFIERMKPVLGSRRQTARIGILYSTQTQHYFLAPGGSVGFDWNTTSDPTKDGYLDHNLGVYGWGGYFEQNAIPYVTIPDFRLSPNALKNISVLILPHVLVMDETVVTQSLLPFIDKGGTIVVTGERSGLYKSKKFIFDKNNKALLQKLTLQQFPKGKALFVAGNPGFDYYVGRLNPAGQQFKNAQTSIKALLASLVSQGRWNPEVEISGFNGKTRLIHHVDQTSPIKPKLFVDLHNTDFSTDLDSWKDSPKGIVKFELPKSLEGKVLKVVMYSFENATAKELAYTVDSANKLSVTLADSELKTFVTLVIEQK